MKIKLQLTVLIFPLAILFAQGADNPAVDSIFAQFTRSGSPGCALGVYRDGKMIYAKGYGLANIELQVPITPASVLDIGSTSKQFTAASILFLEKQGKLRLDDDIHKYLPELADYGHKVTILNLLNHTSGVRDYLAHFAMAGINMDSVTTDDTALAILTRQKALNFPPGSEFLYSNSGYFLLSIIVKRASGKSLREFAQENIFAPLGMTQTQYRDNHRSLIPNRALAYDTASGGFQLDVSYFEQLGDGAVHTSVEDLLRWDENFYTAQVGGKELLAELQEPGKLNEGKVLDYAKGLGVGINRGLRVVRHGGAWGGYRAELLRFPDQHFSVACLCNLGSSNPSVLADRTAEVFLGDQMKAKESRTAANGPRDQSAPPGAPPDADQLPAYAGDYACEELGVVYRLAAANGKLSLEAILDSGGFPRTTSAAALRANGDQFVVVSRGVRLHFAKDANGIPTSFEANAGRTKGLIFHRVAAK